MTVSHARSAEAPFLKGFWYSGVNAYGDRTGSYGDLIKYGVESHLRSQWRSMQYFQVQKTGMFPLTHRDPEPPNLTQHVPTDVGRSGSKRWAGQTVPIQPCSCPCFGGFSPFFYLQLCNCFLPLVLLVFAGSARFRLSPKIENPVFSLFC